MLSIKFDCIHFLPTGPLPSLFVEWLGHYWSYCYINLSFLIQRMIGVSNDRFKQEIAPLDVPLIKNPSYPPSPGLVSPALTPRQDRVLEEADQLRPVAEKQQIVEGENKDEEKWKRLFTSDQTPIEKDKIDQPSNSPAKEESELKEDPTPIKTSPDNLQEPSTPQLVQPDNPKAEDPVLDDDLLLKEIDVPPSDTKIEPEQPDDPKPLIITGERRRRPWRGESRLDGWKPLVLPAPSIQPDAVTPLLPRAKASPKPSPKISISRVLKTKLYPKHVLPSDFARLKKDYEIIDCGANGDCQLQCILEGLKRQHPKLANDEKQKVTFTALDLRQMGVALAREIMDKDDLMTGCIDSDLLEYDDDIMQDEQKRKTSDAQIDTHEEFLNCLEKPGFYCSKVHLYALSMKFKVPIYVHQIREKKDAKIQTIHFNPANSKLEPIQLIHERTHYKLMQKRKSPNH